MSEGAAFAWKVQTVDTHRGPVGNYRNLRRPLSNPPAGKVWAQHVLTREWYLEDEDAMPASMTEGDTDVYAATVVEVDPNDNVEKKGEVSLPDFVEHLVQPHETFEGLCVRYKVTPTEIRQANGGFSGTNLKLAPNPLKIPLKLLPNKKSPRVEDTAEFKLSQMARACPKLSTSEARCYLELNDWDAHAAIDNAHEDGF